MPYQYYDGKSQPFFFAEFDAGPSIGKVRRPIYNDRIITASGNISVEPYDFRIIINKVANEGTIVTLPFVNVWAKSAYGMTPIIIKDGKGNAAAFNITVQSQSGELIDGQPFWLIAGDYASLYIVPKSDLTGWILS